MRLSIIAAILPLALAAPAVEPAPLLAARDSQGIEGKYIVKLKDSAAVSVLDFQSKVAKTDHVYQNVIKGFSASLSKDEVERLRQDPDASIPPSRTLVEYVEQDAIVRINGITEQRGAPWGLVRISHRKRGGTSYAYDTCAGKGVCAYIIDTGIDASHPDFGGRAKQIKSFASTQTDRNGHGTHCAGIVGSNTYGVAKKVSIFGVKVLDDDGTGYLSSVIAGMEFVSLNRHSQHCPKGVVVNMSFGGDYSAALNQAVARLQSSGCFVAAAAGNENTDARTTSPASESSICTVGATDSNDRRSPFSNYGRALDIFAPGSDITSTGLDGRIVTSSGTSSATPHITGLGAYLMSLEGVGAAKVCTRIQNLSTKNVISGLPADTVNYLAFNNAT